MTESSGAAPKRTLLLHAHAALLSIPLPYGLLFVLPVPPVGALGADQLPGMALAAVEAVVMKPGLVTVSSLVVVALYVVAQVTTIIATI